MVHTQDKKLEQVRKREYYEYMNKERLIDHCISYEEALHKLIGKIQFLYIKKDE